MKIAKQYDGQVVFILSGRAFVLSDLKKSILAASGGYATGIWMTWKDQPVWETVETIELVAMLHEKED